jgi:GTP-binding protein
MEDLPRLDHLPEVAVVGRSNVGKSSLLNHLFGSKNLVKVSSTPGKTRALNFFCVDSKYIFVDLPGYGYAAISKHESRQWAELIENYLEERGSLKILLFLLDIRREPTDEDVQMLEWIRHKKREAILILTKTDKVSQSEKSSQTKRITDRIKGLPYVHYSATKNIGRKELTALLRDKVG